MKVTNINETDIATKEYNRLLDHWKNFSGEKVPESCQEKSCANKPEVGGLVRKNSSTDRGLYVLPLCAFHNDKKGEQLNVKNSVNLVSINAGDAAANLRTEERFWTFKHPVKEGDKMANIHAN